MRFIDLIIGKRQTLYADPKSAIKCCATILNVTADIMRATAPTGRFTARMHIRNGEMLKTFTLVAVCYLMRS
jgi:hypothetical protein